MGTDTIPGKASKTFKFHQYLAKKTSVLATTVFLIYLSFSSYLKIAATFQSELL